MPERPYKGLMPYDEADAPFFFGREGESEIISANLMASRLTLLYGPSGVGKSSVLRAGVVRDLRARASQNLIDRGTPEFAIIVFASWRDDPLSALCTEVEVSVSSPPQKRSLIDTLTYASDAIDGDLLIILDQFEEYFLYHSQEDGDGTFAVEFPKAVNRRDLRASFLVSIREDALAKLDRFKGRIPGLFDNYLRIDHLDRTSARAAIEKPIIEYNRLLKTKASIEPPLVETILDQVTAGRVVLGAAGRGVIDGAGESRVETPYLQLVMTRLWDEEVKASEPPMLRLATLERLGGAERIVRTHLDTTMSALPPEEQDAAARVFRFLVTPSGTKIAHTPADLAEYGRVPLSLLEPVLEKLSGTGVRILRPVAAPLDEPGPPRYEIYHDVLAGAIVDWRARYVRAQELAEGDRKLAEARHRANRLRWGIIGLSLMVLVMIGLVVFAFQQRSTARHAQAEAVSQRVVAEKAKSEAVAQRDNAEKAQAEAVFQRITAEKAQSEAVAQRDNAEHARVETEAQRQVAVARELAAAALNNLDVNPERSLLLSLYAVSATASHGRPVLREAEEALHRSVQASRLQLALGAGHGPGEAGCVGAVFSPDGKRVATANRGRSGAADIWDAATGKKLLDLPGHAGQFSGIAFSPDGGRIATAGDDNTARIWDAATGKALLTLSGHTDKVNRVAFSSDGKLMATAGDGKIAKVWDTVTGKELLTLSGHAGRISCIAFSPDGKHLATSSEDKTAKVWDAVTGKEVLTLSSHSVKVSGLAFSPDGKHLAMTEDDDATLWDVSSGKMLTTFHGMGEPNNAIAFDPAGARLVMGYSDGAARVWDVATGRVVMTLSGAPSPIRDVAFSPDGGRVVTASDDGMARLWDVSAAARPEWPTIVPSGGPVQDVAFSPDGRRIATAGGDGTVKVWDASGKALFSLPGRALQLAMSPDGRLATLEGWELRVRDADGKALLVVGLGSLGSAGGMRHHSMAFSPDGARLAMSSSWALHILDASTGKELLTLSAGLAAAVYSVAFSPDGRRIAAGTVDAAQLWDALTGKELLTLPGHEGTTYSVAFSPDGRRIAASRPDKTVKVWDAATGKILSTLSSHQGDVYSVAFSPDGSRLATAGGDGTVKVWDVSKLKEQGGNPLTLAGHSGAIYRVVFSPDGRRLATASEDGTSRVYALAVEDLVAIAKSRVTRGLTAEECEKFLHAARCPPAP